MPASEWPTWVLIVVVYGGWWLTLALADQLPVWVFLPLLVFLLALHSSMNHELIHCHPTRNAKLNDFMAYPPLALLYPYPLFKVTHLQHHRDEDITYPGIDPESFFITHAHWEELNRFQKALAWVNMTLAGRFLLFPARATISMSLEAIKSIFRRDEDASMWLIHLTLVTVILLLVTRVFQVDLWLYLIAAYFSQSMILIRSFFEHRPVERVSGRIVIQDAGLLFRLLYLNNNYHLVHHQHPGLPWFAIPAEYRANKAWYLKENDGYHYPGYFAWLRYLFRPIHAPRHPWK